MSRAGALRSVSHSVENAFENLRRRVASDLADLVLAAFAPVIAAYAISWARGFDRHLFATISNLSYVAVAAFLKTVDVNTRRDLKRERISAGFLDDGASVLAFLGAGSFAFHISQETGTKQHVLDVVLGVVLVAHCAFAAVATLACVLLKRVLSSVLVATNVAWLVALVAMFSKFDFIYDEFRVAGLDSGGGSGFYLVFGGVAALTVLGSRFLFYRVNADDPASRRIARAAFLLELVAMSSVLAGALWAQCTILPPHCKYDDDPSSYDLFHGNWHVLLAVATGYVYLRSADLRSAIQYREYRETRDVGDDAFAMLRGGEVAEEAAGGADFAFVRVDTGRLGPVETTALAFLLVYASTVVALRLVEADSRVSSFALGAIVIAYVAPMCAARCRQRRAPRVWQRSWRAPSFVDMRV
jgi:hypothetical protein